MDNSALLIIDMQNVYLPGNDWACTRANEITKYIRTKMKEFSEDRIFFTQHKASENPKGIWKKYNEQYEGINSNDYLNDIVIELKKYTNENNLFIKSGFSALSNEMLLEKLKAFDTIYVTGVVAECCVLSTIFSLIDMGKKIIYCNDGIAGKNEDTEKAVKKVLLELSPLHVEFK